MKKNNIYGFSIVIAMWLTMVIGLMAFYLLEYMIPFSRNVKWVENSTKAYYQALSWVEEALIYIGTWWIGAENTVALTTSPISTAYDIKNTFPLHPPLNTWNSPLDDDWNIIAPGHPIQIYLPRWITNFSSFRFYFRVPNFDSNSATLEEFNDANLIEKDIINWQLLSKTNTLNSHPVSSYTDNRIQKNYICDSSKTTATCTWYRLDIRQWYNLQDTNSTLGSFYTTQCNGADYDCLLKFSIVNELNATTWGVTGTIKKIPFLEYRITFWAWLGAVDVPSHIIEVDTSWKSYGYRKDLNISFPQKGTLEAFDFTIFQ